MLVELPLQDVTSALIVPASAVVIATGGCAFLSKALGSNVLTGDDEPEVTVMDFSAPIFISTIKLLTHHPHPYTTLSDLKGQTVVVLGRTPADGIMQAYSRDNALDLKVVRALNPAEALAKLRAKIQTRLKNGTELVGLEVNPEFADNARRALDD